MNIELPKPTASHILHSNCAALSASCASKPEVFAINKEAVMSTNSPFGPTSSTVLSVETTIDLFHLFSVASLP